MELKKILLSVKRSKFRSDDPSADESNAEFTQVRKTILERDDYTCQFCGFRAMKHQEVHHVNDDHADNSPENLVTICCLCHACHHIGLTGIKGRGDIIYLDPSMKVTQSNLNQLVRTLWIAEIGDNKDMQRIAIEKLAKLYKATVTAKRKIGTSDPSILGDFMLSLDEQKYQERDVFLSGVYLLPRSEQFKAQIDYWKDNLFKSIPPSSWSLISKQKIEKWIKNQEGDVSNDAFCEFINKNRV
ncbi:hypothetical protein D3C87_351480 [compost metagenome]